MALIFKSTIPHSHSSASYWPNRICFIYAHYCKIEGFDFPYGEYVKVVNSDGFLAIELQDNFKHIDIEAYNHITYVARLHGAEEQIE